MTLFPSTTTVAAIWFALVALVLFLSSTFSQNPEIWEFISGRSWTNLYSSFSARPTPTARFVMELFGRSSFEVGLMLGPVNRWSEIQAGYQSKVVYGFGHGFAGPRNYSYEAYGAKKEMQIHPFAH